MVFFRLYGLVLCLINRQISADCSVSVSVSSDQHAVYKAMCGNAGESDTGLLYMLTILDASVGDYCQA